MKFEINFRADQISTVSEAMLRAEQAARSKAEEKRQEAERRQAELERRHAESDERRRVAEQGKSSKPQSRPYRYMLSLACR